VLKQRVITALVLVTVIGGAIIYLSPLGFAALITVLVLAASWEWSALSGLRSWLSRLAFSASCGLLMAVAAWRCHLLTEQIEWSQTIVILEIACLWWAIALLWVKTYPASSKLWGSIPIRMIMGFLTLIPAWLAFIALRSSGGGIAIILVLIGLVICADTGAYFAGKAWGKRKLAPAVSPGKSWAGFWGGLVISSVFVLAMWWFYGDRALALPTVLFIALLTGLASVLGDLVESMVKRHQGVKDSGMILPGHGGIMDRFDSLTAAAPVFALCLLLVGAN